VRDSESCASSKRRAFRQINDLGSFIAVSNLLASQVKRPRRRLSAIYKLFWIVLRRLWSGWKPPLILVTPRTVVAWHRAVVDGTASENLLTFAPGPYKKGTQTVRDASVKRSRKRHLCKDSNRIMLPEGTPAWHDLLDIEVILKN